MNARLPLVRTRAVLALASIGFALGAWMTPATSIAQQRTTEAQPVTVSGKVVGARAGASRLAYGGDTCSWTSITGSWGNPAGWSCGHVPGIDDEAYISSGRVTLDTGIAVRIFHITGGTLDVTGTASIDNELVQDSGEVILRKDARLAFPHGQRFLQHGGRLTVEIGSATDYGRMDFDNHIGGLGLFGLAGEVLIQGVDGYMPAEDTEFLFMNGSSMSASTGGFTPTVYHSDFPVDFKPVLGLFSGVIRNVYPGSCHYVGGYSVWQNASNWSCGHVPGESDTAILEGNQVVELQSGVTVARLVMRNGTTIVGLDNTLTANGSPLANEFSGNLVLNQDLILALGDSRIVGDAQFSLFTSSIIRNNGTLTTSNTASLGFDSSANGLVRNSAGASMQLRVSQLNISGNAMQFLNEGEVVFSRLPGEAVNYINLQEAARIRQAGGRFVLDETIGAYFDPPPVFELEGGELSGNGRLDFPVLNSGGVVRPGAPASCGGGGEAFAASVHALSAHGAIEGCSLPGYLEFLGYTQTSGGALELAYGRNRDEFNVTGPAQLAGTLYLRDYDNLRPGISLTLFQAFPISGGFDSVVNELPPEYTVVQDGDRTFVVKYTAGGPPAPVAALLGVTFPSAINYGTKFQFTASVRNASSGEPVASGTVHVSVGGTEVCTAVLPDVRCFVTAPIEPGVPVVHAVLESTTHTASAFESTIFVGPHVGEMLLTAPTTAIVGTPVQVTAQLKYLAPAEELFGGTILPTGSLVIRKGGDTICTTPVTAVDASINCSIPVTDALNFSINADYVGDTHWGAAYASRQVTVQPPVDPPATKPAFTSSAPAAGRVGVAYSHTFIATGTSPIAFSKASGQFPPGLGLTNDGMLTGTPTTPGTFTAIVLAGNSAGSATQSVSIAIDAALQTGLSIASGNHQVAFWDRGHLTGDAFALPLVVRLVGPGGAGIAGASVEFVPMAPPSAAVATSTLSASTALTDGQGEARVIATAANFTGAHRVRARVAGLEPVFFDLTNLPRRVASMKVTLPGTQRERVQTTPVLAPFFSRLEVLVSEPATRLAIPGVEVRFYAPFAPGSGQPSAVLEGGTEGQLTADETPRPDDGHYRLYRSVITGSGGLASVDAFANGTKGTYDVFAVLVEGGAADPLSADTNHHIRFPLENSDDIDLVLNGRFQSAAAGARFAGRTGATARFKASSAGIPNAELWVFTGDDALGLPGATVVASEATEGRLPGGERYVALATDIHGTVAFDLVANRYKGRHDVVVAYPGGYESVAKAPIRKSFTLENSSGLAPDGTDRQGRPAAALEVASGDFQRAAIGSKDAFAAPLVVTARDNAGQALSNVLVRFVSLATSATTGRVIADATAILSDSSVLTDAQGRAQVSAFPVGAHAGSFKVRAWAEGAAPIDFTLSLVEASLAGTAKLVPLDRTGSRSSGRIVGDEQSQVVLARFDEALSVYAAIASSGAPLPGQAIRFYFPAALDKDGKPAPTFEPDSGTPGVFTDGAGKAYPYVTGVGDSNGRVFLKGRANAVPGSYEVVAMIPDASAANDNHPVDHEAKDSRFYAFRLTNVVPGADLAIIEGNEQGIELGGTFLHRLEVSAFPNFARVNGAASRDSPPGPTGLDGAEIWFMTPVPTDGNTPAAALIGDNIQEITDSKGRQWHVVAAPIGDDGIAGVHAVANDVKGGHHVIAAYPTGFSDPASAPTRVEFFLCNGQSSRETCRDPELTPGPLEAVDPGPLYSLDATVPALRVRVRNTAGDPIRGAVVTFTTPIAGFTGSAPWVADRTSLKATATTDADGIAQAPTGQLRTTIAGQAYSATATVPRAPNALALSFSRYAPATTMAVVGSVSSTALINTAHRTLQVSTPHRVPLRWRVQAGPNGASATFAGGLDSAQEIAPITGAGTTTYMLPALTANAIAGSFTLKAEAIGSTVSATFAMLNLASAPASVTPIDPAPLYSYNGAAPELRVVVRDGSGTPMRGIEVKFTLPTSGIFASASWTRAGTSLSRTFTTDANGVANGRDGIGLLNAYSEGVVTASVEGVATSATLRFLRYNPVSTLVRTGQSPVSAPILTTYPVFTVTLGNGFPVRWTIIAGANGASGRFADASASQVIHPPLALGPQSARATVVANGIAGAFTLRAEPLDGGAAAVEFALVNLASAPASIAPVDPAPLYSYSLGAPDLRVVVRDASGAPTPAVAVKFTLPTSGISATTSWTRSGSTLSRTFVTDANGVANARDGIGLLNAYSEAVVTATVDGIATGATLRFVRYNPVTTLVRSSEAFAAAPVLTAYPAFAVTLGNGFPVRWTIVAGASGAGGTFADATTTRVVHPSLALGTQSSQAIVIANGIVGAFTLRAEPLDGGAAPVDFRLTNLASAPTSITAVDPAPLYSYSLGAPNLRVIVRDAAGAPAPGVVVRFTLPTSGISATAAWTQSGRSLSRTFVTDANGVANARDGIGLLNAYSEAVVTATVNGIATGATLRFVRYNPVTTLVRSGEAFAAAPVLTAYPAFAVTLGNGFPVRWTIVAGANGAGGTFADATTTRVVHPTLALGTQSSRVTVMANGAAGVFTLRAEPLDGGAAPVDFSLTNLAAAPASIAPADPGPLYTYKSAAPALRVIVRDSAGHPIAGVPVTFNGRAGTGLAFAAEQGWAATGGTFTRTVSTNESGIANGAAGVTMATTYLAQPITAAVGGLAEPVVLYFVRYDVALSMTALTPLYDAVAINHAYPAQRIELSPAVPVRWTIVAGPTGAGGVFATSAGPVTTFVHYPSEGTRATALQTATAAVAANGIPGTFTLRVEALDGGPAPVDFTLTNLAAPPASVQRADTGVLFSYTSAAPPLRAVVRDAAGNALAGVPVTFSAEGNVTRAGGWTRVGNLNVKVVATGPDGIADGSAFLTSSATPNTLIHATASVAGVAATAALNWIRYQALDLLEPVDQLIYSATPAGFTAIRVSSEPPVPLRWTIQAAPGGAGGTMANGSETSETFPVTNGSGAAQVSVGLVRGNGIRGAFTVKVEAIGFDGPAIIFSVVNP